MMPRSDYIAPLRRNTIKVVRIVYIDLAIIGLEIENSYTAQSHMYLYVLRRAHFKYGILRS